MPNAEDSAADTRKRQRGIRNTVIVLLLIVMLVMALAAHKILRPQPMSEAELRAHNAFLFERPRRFSDFTLIDHHNETFERQQLTDHWSLVYFGFTHCPDICPMALMDINRTLETLPEDLRKKTRVILVTLDPARDSPEVLQQYVTAFNPEFIGVTGEFLTIRRFANELNVAFAKTPLGEDYTIDHSTHLVLLNPKGDFHAFFRPPFHPETLGVSFKAIADRWR